MECWVSKACGFQYDKSIGGVSYVVTPEGMLDVAAHVEAERSSITGIPGQAQYLYKLTFYVKAPADKNVSFNVWLGAGMPLFSQEMRVDNGQEYSATGDRAIVQYSVHYYDNICLKFSRGGIPDVCNTIPESDYSKDNYLNAGGGGMGAGGTAAGGAVVNQI